MEWGTRDHRLELDWLADEEFRTTMFDLLSIHTRRDCLRYLDTYGAAEVSEIAKHIAQQREDSDWSENVVENALSQNHLIRLGSEGLVEFDQESGTVEKADEWRFNKAIEILESVTSLEEHFTRAEIDSLFDGFSHRHRLKTIQALYELSGEAVLSEIAFHVANYEDDTGDIAKEHKKMYATLYNVHIPKLSECNIVEKDDETQQVTLVKNDDTVEYLLYDGFNQD